MRTFKAKRSKLKLYTPRKQLFKKKTFEKGDVVRHKRGGTFRYGRIVCFVHPDGLYSTSHEQGYNGKDLLECVLIDKKPGLIQIIGPDGQPKRFQAQGKDCKIMKVITTDSKGEETTMHRLDLSDEEEDEALQLGGRALQLRLRELAEHDAQFLLERRRVWARGAGLEEAPELERQLADVLLLRLATVAVEEGAEIVRRPQILEEGLHRLQSEGAPSHERR